MKPLLSFCLFLACLHCEPALPQTPGTKVWMVLAPQPIVSSPAIAPDGTIYVGTGNSGDLGVRGSLCSFSPQGTTNWVLSFPRAVKSSPSIGPDGRVYVGCYNGELMIIRPSGDFSAFATGGYIPGSPAIASDGTVYISAISNRFNKLFALTPDGALKWVFGLKPLPSPPLASYQESSPAIGPDGTIYVGSEDMNLYSIHPDGTTNWVLGLGAVTYSSPVIGADGTIYIGADNEFAFAVRPDGVLKWKARVSGAIESSAAVSADGTVYFGTLIGGVLYALDQAGKVKWQYSAGGISASAAIDAEGTVYVGSYSTTSFLHAVSPWGTNRWRFTAPDRIWSSPAIGPDGTIYVASGNKLYALYGTNALMSSSWPMFRGNPRHTGRSIQRGLQGPELTGDGGARLTLNVETGRVYQVEFSTNLVHWEELTNFVSETLTNRIVDQNAGSIPNRFYRLGTTWD